ncbi:hypothetical protein C9I91_22340, partial [Photobacterium jeanii]|uniref:hypothetical protein n=1 Tax=Photobacterium jeanii TaxID=858640 RepID=UPI000D453738
SKIYPKVDIVRIIKLIRIYWIVVYAIVAFYFRLQSNLPCYITTCHKTPATHYDNILLTTVNTKANSYLECQALRVVLMALLPARVKVPKQLACHDAMKLALLKILSGKLETQR